MSLIKRPGSPYWWISLRIGDKLIRKSTKIPVKGATPSITADNKRDALQMEAKFLAGDRKVRFALDGAAIERGVTLAAWLPEWRTLYQVHHADSTKQNYDSIIPRLIDGFGALPLGAIVPDVVVAWRVQRLAVKADDRKCGRLPKPQTVNGDVRCLKIIIKDAVTAGRVHDQETGKPLAVSPLAGFKSLKPKDKAEKAVMTEDQEDRVLSVMEHVEDRALLICGMDTMQRVRNLLDIRRRHDRGDVILFPKTKNNEAHEAPVTPRMRKALDAIPVCACGAPECALRHQPFYFVKRRRADRKHWASGVRQMLEYACTRAGVPYGRAKGSFTWHRATRGTGPSRLAEAGYSLSVIQDAGNWKTAQQAADYITVDSAMRRRAVCDIAPKATPPSNDRAKVVQMPSKSA